jgi:predicted O-methyltransferase YrrM
MLNIFERVKKQNINVVLNKIKMSDFVFTQDWFTNNIPLWQKELARYKTKPIKMLEVGTYEGRSALWAVENILTHPKSQMYCVDSFPKPQIYNTFMANIKKYHMKNPHVRKDKIKVFKGLSRDMLKTSEMLNTKFDIIYIDADHRSESVLEDAVLAFPLLKSGGLLIFDDYTASKQHDNRCPKPAIDSFLNAYANDIRVLYTRWQVVVQKRLVPRAKPECHSEFYDYK